MQVELQIKTSELFTHFGVVDLTDPDQPKVIHYQNAAGNKITPEIMSEDLNSFYSRCFLRIHKVNNRTFDGNTTVDRANQLLGIKDFDPFGNNCESFIHFVTCGEVFSTQGNTAVSAISTGVVAGIPLAYVVGGGVGAVIGGGVGAVVGTFIFPVAGTAVGAGAGAIAGGAIGNVVGLGVSCLVAAGGAAAPLRVKIKQKRAARKYQAQIDQ